MNISLNFHEGVLQPNICIISSDILKFENGASTWSFNFYLINIRLYLSNLTG